MSKLERINSIKEFMHDCGANDGLKIEVNVDVHNGTEHIHHGSADIYCLYKIEYKQYQIDIIWEFDDLVMRSMGLNGSYNTNFQDFLYSNNTLTIINGNIVIDIYKE